MRGSWLVRWSVFVLILLGIIPVGTSAAEPVCQCLDFAARVVGGFAGGSATLQLEGAIGLPEYSVATWMDVDLLPVPTSMFGGELSLTRDWLSIGLAAQQAEAGVDLNFQGRANPPSWLLYDGNPTLIGGISAITKTQLLKAAGRTDITLSPFFTSVIPMGNTTVSPSVGVDLTLDSSALLPAISGARLLSTVNAGCVLIASTVHFDGFFAAFSSLVLSVNVPEWGLTVSGSLLPTAAGGFSYHLSVDYEWGDTYLLSTRSEKPESVCTGGVCF